VEEGQESAGHRPVRAPPRRVGLPGGLRQRAASVRCVLPGLGGAGVGGCARLRAQHAGAGGGRRAAPEVQVRGQVLQGEAFSPPLSGHVPSAIPS
jgi:hypothetical protein